MNGAIGLKVVLMYCVPVLGGLVLILGGAVITLPSSSRIFFFTSTSSVTCSYGAFSFSYTVLAGLNTLSWPAFRCPSLTVNRPSERGASLKGSPEYIKTQNKVLTDCDVVWTFVKETRVNLSFAVWSCVETARLCYYFAVFVSFN